MITVQSRRNGRHIDKEGKNKPDHIIHNFWDLLELIDNEFEIVAD